jgi:Fur family transcriptional regulator, ferric uptake regulator
MTTADDRSTGAGSPAPRRRDTAARRAIARAIARGHEAFTARELYERLQGPGRVGLTTVYRNLARLQEEGVVREMGRRGGEVVFLACTAGGHHHHLVCVNCGVVVRSDVCRCDELERELTRRHGFTLSGGTSDYYGVCAACAAKAPRAAGAPGIPA